MSDAAPIRLLVGPQRPTVYLGEAIDASGIAARSFAVISAGWQEAENDIDEIRNAVGLPLVDLQLYARAERLFHDEPALQAAYRERQERLREQQRIYALRLRQLAIAARHTLRQSSDADIAAAERRHAIRQLRALDRHHLRATERLHAEFDATWQPDGVPSWRHHRDEIAALLDEHDAVLITGGNVIVLMNRLRLFDLSPLLANKPVVGLSAGAMVMAPRIVLFHDRMPQGRREPEVLGAGCALLPDVLVLPDIAHRLQQRDPLRLGLMARRFVPQRCIALDNGEHAQISADGVVLGGNARRLTRGGKLVRQEAS